MVLLDRTAGWLRGCPSVRGYRYLTTEAKSGRDLPANSPPSPASGIMMLICRLPKRKAVEGDGKARAASGHWTSWTLLLPFQD